MLCLSEDGNLLAIIDPNLGLDPGAFGAVTLSEAFAGVDGLDERVQTFVDLLRATAADQMRIVAVILRRAADSLRFQRGRIGDLPLDREAILFNTGVDWRHPFTNGSAVISSISLDSSEDNFRDKQLNPTLGDSFVANQFRFTAGLALDLPLGRGGGKVSAQAPVIAAGHGVDAARALLEHTAAERALVALEAYWDTAAAAERVALLDDSSAIQERLLGATEQLVEADVVPRVDLALNRARLSTVHADTAGARQALEFARAALVRTVGLGAEELAAGPQTEVGLESWIAGEPLAAADVERLIQLASERREDLQAAESVVEANRALAAAARHDLLPDFRLSFNLSYNAFHESFSERFYDPEGFEKAIEGVFAGPSYGLALTFRLPVGNNSARGRLLQSRVRHGGERNRRHGPRAHHPPARHRAHRHDRPHAPGARVATRSPGAHRGDAGGDRGAVPGRRPDGARHADDRSPAHQRATRRASTPSAATCRWWRDCVSRPDR